MECISILWNNFILRMIHRRDISYHVTPVIKTNTTATEVYSQSLRAEKTI